MSIVYEIDPPRRGIIHLFTILVAGAAGAASALVADFYQKGEASAIFVANVFLNNAFDLYLPLGYLSLGLLAAGSVAVYIFEPRTKRAAFYTGASILAVAMTGIPVQELDKIGPLLNFEEAPPLGDISARSDFIGADGMVYEIKQNCADNGGGRIEVIKASFIPGSASAITCNDGMSNLVTPVQLRESLPVTVTVTIPGASQMPNISARLYDAVSGKAWDLGSRAQVRRTPDGLVIDYATRIPTSGSDRGLIADLHVRIEAEGYAIAHVDVRVASADGMVSVPMSLKRSDTPLWLQRLQTPYRF